MHSITRDALAAGSAMAEAQGDSMSGALSTRASSGKTSAQYWLVKHAYVCETQNGLVVLDLKRDKYVGLGGGTPEALAGIVHGWPVCGVSNCNAIPRTEADRVAESMVEAGLLTRDPKAGKIANTHVLARDAVMGSIGFEFDHFPVRLHHVINFVAAYMQATWALRWHSLECAVNSVKARKERARSLDATFDQAKAAELVNIFRRLRSYAFTTKGQCLFHALTLMYFLSRYNIFPLWVIGVKTGPFRAHSWVQQGGCVLDGTPEQVSFYTPILAV